VFTNNTIWFDTNGAGTAAALAATNNFGKTVAVTITNAANQFTGTFTNGTYYGNGNGLTNLNWSSITNPPAIPSTNGLGSAAYQNTNFFDLSGAGTAAALAATNAMGKSSGLSAFQNTNFFDLAGAGTAAALAATNAGNIMFTSLLPALTNQFLTTNGNGSRLTNYISWSQLTNTIVTNIFNGTLQSYTLTNTAGVTMTNFTGTSGSISYLCYSNIPVTITNVQWLTPAPVTVTNGVISFTAYGTNIEAAYKERDH
jgi:hypothetical protein